MTCLIDQANELLASASARSPRMHVVNLLETGDEALYGRVRLIREARRRIDLQTFIWANDESGRYIARELLRAAERGVRVRVIVDGWVVLGGPELLSSFGSAHPQLTVKHFNPPANMLDPTALDIVSAALTDFAGMNHRMHSKALIVDEEAVILGGRNYQNDYYDRGTTRIFHDREVLCFGPVVSDAARSFDLFWSSPISVLSEDLHDVTPVSGSADLPAEMRESSTHELFGALEERLSREEYLNAFAESALRLVDDVEFVGDVPGSNPEMPNATCNELVHFLSEVQDRLVINSPYFVLDPLHEDVLRRVRSTRPDIQVVVLTNSLASTDNVLAYAHSFRERGRYLRELRLEIFELRPQPAERDAMVGFQRGADSTDSTLATICGHAKTYIRDQAAVWIGSSNIDPRSARLNTENGVVIRDHEFTKEVLKLVERDLDARNSWTVGLSRQAAGPSILTDLFLHEEKGEPDARGMQNPENFEPKDSAVRFPFFHPDFYEHYQSVGPFPLVEGSARELEVRMLLLLPEATKMFV